MNNCEESKNGLIVFQGADSVFDIYLAYPDKTPLDLTGVTALKALLMKADNTTLELSLGSGVTVLSPASSGKVNITMSEIQTGELRVGRNQSIELEITFGTDVRIVQLIAVMEVRKRLFPQ